MGKTIAAKKATGNGNGANLGFEATLWPAADKLRSNMDASEYKHVALGRIFLKYISDAFETFAKPLWSRIHLIQAEILELASLRTALLPKRLSGEMRIAEVQKEVSRHA